MGCAVILFALEHEMLGASGFSKYYTFSLEVMISWDAGNGGDLRIIYNNLLYLSFQRMCFAWPLKFVQLMQECNPFVIKKKQFSRPL